MLFLGARLSPLHPRWALGLPLAAGMLRDLLSVAGGAQFTGAGEGASSEGKGFSRQSHAGSGRSVWVGFQCFRQGLRLFLGTECAQSHLVPHGSLCGIPSWNPRIVWVGRDFKTLSTIPGCSKPHLSCPWTLPGMEQPQSTSCEFGVIWPGARGSFNSCLNKVWNLYLLFLSLDMSSIENLSASCSLGKVKSTASCLFKNKNGTFAFDFQYYRALNTLH